MTRSDFSQSALEHAKSEAYVSSAPFCHTGTDAQINHLENDMGDNTDFWIDDVRRQVAPSDQTLLAARMRRDEVLEHATDFPGALRGYASGSIAHLTANDDTDADCGVVLDRRVYPQLGPDGGGEGPNDTVEAVRTFLRARLQPLHHRIGFRVTRRAIQIVYGEPLPGGTDPIVEVIVGLTRKAGALWIPNKARDGWDASDPEKHTELLLGGGTDLRRTRTRTVRVAKAWNKQYAEPCLCSFNIEALALSALDTPLPLGDSLLKLFDYSAQDLAVRLTPDPAGVSKPIKLPLDRGVVVDRLRGAAALVQLSLKADREGDANAAQTAMAELFWKYVSPPEGATSRAAIANALRRGNGEARLTGGAVTLGTAGLAMKTTRAFGR